MKKFLLLLLALAALAAPGWAVTVHTINNLGDLENLCEKVYYEPDYDEEDIEYLQ